MTLGLLCVCVSLTLGKHVGIVLWLSPMDVVKVLVNWQNTGVVENVVVFRTPPCLHVQLQCRTEESVQRGVR